MIKINYFRFIIATIIACITMTVSAQHFVYDNPTGEQGMTLLVETRGNVSINFSIHEFELTPLTYKGEEMSEISLSGITIPNDKGMPNLPRISRFIAIPQGAEALVTIKRSDSEIIPNVNIAPALEIQIENADPIMEYVKNEKVYNTNKLYPSTTIELSEKMSLRGVDAVILGITPFQYNPITKELIVYRNMQVDVEFVGGTGYIGDDRYRSRWFDPILANTVINFESLPKINYEKRLQDQQLRDADGCEYLIVIPNDETWRPYAEQIRQYRIRQGVNTKIMSLNEMECTTNTQMKTFFHNAYNTWEIPPVAVLLMADHGTNMTNRIPAETISHPYSGSCITDNQYADVTGDYLPEMIFARMTAETTADLEIMVSKVFEYEYENPCMDASYYQTPVTALGWQTERWFQICSEIIGGYFRSHDKNPHRINAIYSGTPGSTWSSAQNTSSVTSYFGPTGLGYIPAAPSELGGWTGGTPEQIVEAINEGAFIVQHRDHGYEIGWGEPNFTNSHVAQLNNVGKLTYVFSINCLTGKFNNSTPCFAENFHRRTTSDGQNAGAVGILCPTEVSYSFVNDAFTWGVYDLFQPDFMPTYGPYAENSGNWMPAFGNVAGKYFLAQSSWPYNTDDKLITYQMFTPHSDPFLRLYSEVPQNLTVSHLSTILAGVTSIAVSCEEGTLIALTVGDKILAVAEATGTTQNIIIEPQIPTTEILITCTKQNYLRYESTINVVPAEGAYVIGYEWNIIDENGNGILEYNENGSINMIVKNVGVEAASNVVMTISTEDPYITINKFSETFGTIEPEATVLKNNAFNISVAQNVPNNYNISFKLTATDGTNSWVSYMSVKVYAPIIAFASSSVFGDITPGSTLDVLASFKNTGGAPIYNSVGTISTTNQYITINNTQHTYGDIDGSGTAEGIYNITINENAPATESYDFHVVLLGSYEVASEGDFTIQNVCNVVFTLNDSYGDGWNGAKIRVTFDDGTPQVEYTISSGSTTSFTKEINVGTNVTLTWVSGSWDSECSFTVAYEDGDQIYASSGTPVAGIITTFECNCNGGSNGCYPIDEINASVNGTDVTLEWNAVENATSYTIKRNGVKLETVTTLSYTDLAVTPGNKSYCVSAIYSDGCVSIPSCVDVVVSLCSSVNNFVATADEAEPIITLTWAVGEEATEYNIYYDGILIATTTATSYTISELLYHTEYCYAITAMCEQGESAYTYACATTPYETCYIPINVIPIAEEEMTMYISWDATTTALEYDVYRDGSLIATVSRPFYIDEGLEIGTYCYTVRAICIADESNLSDESCGDILTIQELSKNYKIYPNPANTYILVEGENIEAITLYNTLGQAIETKNIKGDNTILINTESLTSGFYIIRVVSNNGSTSVERISIAH